MLSNKKAVITGGSDGIGLGIAQAFAEQGADLLLIGRDRGKLEKAAAEVSGCGGRAATLSWDLSAVDSIAELGHEIRAMYPEIDILVNNAGTARFTPFAEVQQQELDLLIDLNVKAPYLLTQALLAPLTARKASVINISSYFSRRMLPGRPSTAYSLSKGAMDAFTRALAYELGPNGVRVNAIAPGTVNSALVRANLDRLSDEGRQKFAAMVQTIYPLGRIGEPEDIGGMAVYLASDQARWVTGGIFAIDGGLTTN